MIKKQKKEFKIIKKTLSSWVGNYGDIWVYGNSEQDVKDKMNQKLKEREQEKEYFEVDWGK